MNRANNLAFVNISGIFSEANKLSNAICTTCAKKSLRISINELSSVTIVSFSQEIY